jgi:hypothetical protein
VRRFGREDGADVQGTEGAGAEGTERIERGDDGVGVLEKQAAGGSKCEDGAKGAIESLNFELAVAGKGGGAFECEGKQGGQGEVVGV